eukprot:scaffold11046_cov183-Amphora_coffeaeformis.AAC.19
MGACVSKQEKCSQNLLPVSVWTRDVASAAGVPYPFIGGTMPYYIPVSSSPSEFPLAPFTTVLAFVSISWSIDACLLSPDRRRSIESSNRRPVLVL